MKKSELKTGMVIETSEGKRGIVMLGTKGGDIIAGNGDHENQTWFPLHNIDDNLNYRNNNLKIVKVFDFSHNDEGGNTNRVGELLWEIPQETFYKVGEKFYGEGENFILAQVYPGKVLLISTDDGGRWNVAISVKSISKITESEFAKISESGIFKKI